MHNTSERASRLEGFLKIDPANVQLMRELADTYYKDGDLDRALARYTQLLTIQGESPQDLNRIASVHLAAGRWSEAADLLQRAVQMDPQVAALHFNKAYAELARGRAPEALQAAKRAVELDATQPRFFYYLSLINEECGDPEAAARALARCLELDPQHCEANLFNAYKALESMDVERAGQIAAATVQAHPSSTEALALKAQVDLLRLDPDSALRALSEGLARQPNDVELMFAQGQVLLAVQRYDEARDVLRKALAADPRNPQGQLTLGWACAFCEDAAGARSAFEAVLNLDADHADAWAGLALIHVSQQKMDEAQRCLTKALAADPECAAALWVRAGLAGMQGNDAERRSWLARFERTHAFGTAGLSNRELLERVQGSPMAKQISRQTQRFLQRQQRGKPAQPASR